jgi:G3E family GTPase
VLRQLAQADMLLLNQTDLISKDTLGEVCSCLADRAAAVPIYEPAHSAIPLEVLLGQLEDRHQTEGIETVGFTRSRPSVVGSGTGTAHFSKHAGTIGRAPR